MYDAASYVGRAARASDHLAATVLDAGTATHVAVLSVGVTASGPSLMGGVAGGQRFNAGRRAFTMARHPASGDKLPVSLPEIAVRGIAVGGRQEAGNRRAPQGPYGIRRSAPQRGRNHRHRQNYAPGARPGALEL